MTKKKELDELTDAAALRKLFPKEVVEEVKRVAKEADKRGNGKHKPPKTKDLT